MTEEQIDLLKRFVGMFGYPDESGYLSFFVWGRNASQRDFPKGTRLYPEASVEFVWRLKTAGLLCVSDHRQGFEFDGRFGSNPGWMPGKPTDPVAIIIDNDEAFDWLRARRPT